MSKKIYIFLFIFLILKKKLLSGGASRWRVCYQRGLPRLVFVTKWWSLSGEDLLSTGPTPSSLFVGAVEQPTKISLGIFFFTSLPVEAI